MSLNIGASTSLLFYTNINYAGTNHSVAHGETGTLATSNDSWAYKSVAMNAMHAFCWSGVNTADASLNYQNHTESLITANIADLTAMYAATAFPLFYLGINPAVATPVWLDMSAVTGDVNAVAATALVGGATTSITTLSRPGLEGVAGFVGLTAGSSVVASCSYGTYNATSGQVAWSGLNAGTLVLEYTGGAVTILSATGFPDGWTFVAPAMQSDGSWKVAITGGAVSGNVISSLVSDKSGIRNDGTDVAMLTATVTDSSGTPMSGVTVNWNTTPGNLSRVSSVTDSNGHATTTLTDNGDTGACVVTASLDNGSEKSVSVTLTDSSSGAILVSVTSDKDSIANDGEDQAYLTATVQDAAGNPVQGVTVTWTTDLGTLNHKQQDTDATGRSHARLSDLGDTGIAVVTATLPDGTYKYATIIVEAPGGKLHISSLTSDRDTIDSEGSQPATLTATVVNEAGAAVEGVTVYWSTTVGSLNYSASLTDNTGQATAILSGNNTEGTATVTALLANGSTATLDIGLIDSHFTVIVSSYAIIGNVNTSNKVAIYGAPGAVATLKSEKNKFDNKSDTCTCTLDETGYGLVLLHVMASYTDLTVTIGERSQTTAIVAASNTGDAYHNGNTPADGRTPLTYTLAYSIYSPKALKITLEGTAYFADGTQTCTLEYVGSYATTEIFNTVGGHQYYKISWDNATTSGSYIDFVGCDYSAQLNQSKNH